MKFLNAEKKGWFITLLGALFFFYAFIQANMLTPLSAEIAKSFDANASALSLLSATYFYSNIIFIIPAGLLLDRYSVRLLMCIGLILAIIGSFMFAFALDLKMAYVGRSFCGIMMAFGLVSCLKLASLLLPSGKMALASSLIITIGMFGGIVSQTLVAFFNQLWGWRGAIISLSFLGVLILLILFFVVRVPNPAKLVIKSSGPGAGIKQSLKEVFHNRQNWYSGFFISFVNFPIAILGALFGVPCLTQLHKFSYLEACGITSMLFFGMIFGSPFFGWFSDYLKKRKPLMYIGTLSCIVFTLVAIFSSNLSPLSAYVLFFLVGFSSSAQVLGYPVISESNPPRTSGTALSLAALIIMGLGYGLGLPFVGWILDLTWEGQIVGGMNVYSAISYKKALLTLPIATIIGLIMIFFIKETHCRAIKNEDY